MKPRGQYRSVPEVLVNSRSRGVVEILGVDEEEPM